MVVQDEGSSSVTCTSSSQQPIKLVTWLRQLKSDERGLYLIHLLARCASSVAAGALDQANACLEHIALLATPDGDAMQRIASHFTQALARRLLRHWPGLYRALHPPVPGGVVASDATAAQLLARQHLFDFCPFVKLAFLVSNYAILEAMEGEKVVHVVDLGGASADAAQWVALLQALSFRPEGPPHLRITIVSECKNVLDQSSARLSQEAERLDVPFQFTGVVSQLDSLDFDSLRIKSGEAVAISSVLQLHYLLSCEDKGSSQPMLMTKNYNDHLSTCTSLSYSSKKMDSFLASLWGLSPKVVVIAEQEANHNGLTLMERFTEALNYYAAVFDCLESSKAGVVERERVEKLIFGEEIKNIIACEGMERRERHEKVERWVERMESVGFGMVRMSYYGLMMQCRRLLQSCSDGYKVVEHKGCLFLCWHDRPLYSVSAWNCKRF